MSAPQAAAITACTACAAVGGAAAGGAFSSGTTAEDHVHEETQGVSTKDNSQNTKQPPQPEEPTWTSLVNESNKSEYQEANKIGKVYEKYLVGSYGANGNGNEKWWEKSFKKFQEDHQNTQGTKRNFSSKFTQEEIKAGFKASDAQGDDANKSLNKVCLSVYKEEKSKIEVASEPSQPNDQSKLRDDLWRYCSPLGETPKTIVSAKEEATYNDGNKIGKSKKDKLLSVTANNNLVLWKLKNEEFKVQASLDSYPFFKKWQDEVKKSTTEAPKTIKDACTAAYLLESESTETADKPNESNVVKFCSLLGS